VGAAVVRVEAVPFAEMFHLLEFTLSRATRYLQGVGSVIVEEEEKKRGR
jgi:hypothetical protein